MGTVTGKRLPVDWNPDSDPQGAAVHCSQCGGKWNGMHLVEGVFMHRDPADCERYRRLSPHLRASGSV